MLHRFGERLRDLRTGMGLRQRDLEKALNLRPGACSQYERGLREPGFDLLINIADYFGVSTDYLLGRSADRGATASVRQIASAGRSQVAAAHSMVHHPMRAGDPHVL